MARARPLSEAFDGSSTTRLIPARRASAARRPSRSANRTSVRPVLTPAGRSMTSRSTARPVSSEPAIDRPSSASAGVSTTSHSGLIPRATTSTGSSADARSSQATIEPAACAAAASRNASVVRPLDASPRNATPMPRGTPPGPRMASSSVKPVEKTRFRSGSGRGASSSGTLASAPTTSPAKPGAAAPQRDRSVARAALRSASGARIGRQYRTNVRMNQESSESKEARARLRPSRGDVAQLGEHRVRIAGVRGSSPLISTSPSPRTSPTFVP